jgi:prolyl oligopeptidase
MTGAPETESWVGAQNEVTFSFLDKIPYREALKNRLEELWDYEKLGTPFKEGAFTYFYKNDGLQNQSVLYRRVGEGPPEVFLDPNTFSDDGTTSLSGLSFSKDGSLAAYSISEGGSDWRKIIVMHAERMEILEDTLVDIKFSGISWKGQEGFYYSSYDKPKGSELSAKTDQHKVYYHRIGTPQKRKTNLFSGEPRKKSIGT